MTKYSAFGSVLRGADPPVSLYGTLLSLGRGADG